MEIWNVTLAIYLLAKLMSDALKPFPLVMDLVAKLPGEILPEIGYRAPWR